jgi:glutathione S-transferase
MVLREKGVEFETYEVDLSNKSDEFLAASPTGKVPVVVVDGDSIYESNVVNQYLDEVADGISLLPADPKQRAHARVWMAFADDKFFPALFGASIGRERGSSEEKISEADENLAAILNDLETQLEGRGYLVGEFSLADVAYAGNFVRLREMEEKSVVSLEGYPNVRAWMDRVEARESYKAAL